MSDEISSLPPALHPPNPSLPFRDVKPDDASALREHCWSERSLTRCQELIRRIDEARTLQQGVGVVLPRPNHPDTIIGYGQIRRWTRCAEISDLIIAEGYRGRGYGTALIQHLVQQRDRLSKGTCVEIGASIANPRALGLYRRLGFRESYTINLRVGSSTEPVIYLRLYPDTHEKTP